VSNSAVKLRQRNGTPWRGLGASALAVVLAAGGMFVVGAPAAAQPNAASAAPRAITTSVAAPARPIVEDGVHWQKLKPAQREALKPLQQEWPGIEAARKQKWLELADRLPSMPADERARIQTRMADWARMTPNERGQARLSFQEAKQIPLPDRRSRWEAYQALPPEQKSELAARAAAARAPQNSIDSGNRRAAANGGRPERGDKAPRELSQSKSNIVPNPAYAAPPRPIAPTVVQAAPGATTTLITRRPAPPPHQQTGLPKIAATPEFVNKSTLLPQRGAQGAAIRPVPSADAASAARR
jgi:hypothetical protein